MKKSDACDYPKHAEIKDSDRKHPRYNEYLKYRAAMDQQLVYCPSFESWLSQVQDYETELSDEMENARQQLEEERALYEDYNDQFDDDPNPYNGDYSEE